jgi:AraC-like DNA-binding protein
VNNNALSLPRIAPSATYTSHSAAQPSLAMPGRPIAPAFGVRPQQGLAARPALGQAARPAPMSPLPPLPRPAAPPLPRSTSERLVLGRERIRTAAEAGQRIRSYEVALDLDLSEFHFARLFRAAFGLSPHVFYDEVRAERARALLREGLAEGDVARRIGFRRPAELRALLAKRGLSAAPAEGDAGPLADAAEPEAPAAE